MTQILGPETLPDTMHRFADREGGLAWREYKIPTVVLKKMIGVDNMTTRSVTFTAQRTYDPGDGECNGTAYDLQEADVHTIPGTELPDYVVEASEVPAEEITDPDNTFYFTKKKSTGLFVPTEGDDARGNLVINECIEYGCNNDLLYGLPVVWGEVVHGTEGDGLQQYWHEPAFDLRVIHFAISGQDMPPDVGLDELDVMVYGGGTEGLVKKCADHIMGLMEFLRPPEVDEQIA